MTNKVKSDQNAENQQEIKELIRKGKAFRFIGETISKAYQEEATGEYYVEAIGSSDQEDLVGDIMSQKALKTMEREFVGKTVFMNHRTNVPDDVFGSIVEAKLVKEGGVQLLKFKIVVEKENDAAMKTWRVMAGGRTKLGTSVTVLVKKKLPNPTHKSGIIIDDVEPIELSIVGVACNRESDVLSTTSTKTLYKSAFKALEIAADDDEISPEENPAAELNSKSKEENMSKENVIVAGAGDEGRVMARTVAAVKAYQGVVTALADPTITDKDAAVKALNLPAIVVKGMFNEILDQEPKMWELFDILCDVKWQLMSQKYNLEYLGVTDFTELIALWDETLMEFAAAAKKSFLFWGKFDMPEDVTDVVVSNALDVSKSFAVFADVYGKAPDENRQKMLGFGTEIIELAKSAGIPLGAEAAPATVTESTEEVIRKSPIFVETEARATDAEAKLAKSQSELEIAKALLESELEAVQKDLKQPLQPSNQPATSKD